MITKKQLEIAEFNAILGNWNKKELYRRLKASYNTEKLLNKEVNKWNLL